MTEPMDDAEIAVLLERLDREPKEWQSDYRFLDLIRDAAAAIRQLQTDASRYQVICRECGERDYFHMPGCPNDLGTRDTARKDTTA